MFRHKTPLLIIAGALFFSPGVHANASMTNFEHNPPANADLTVSRKVTTSTGSSIAGATVTLKGSNTATITDQNGNFSIKISSNKSVLVISLTGYGTFEKVASSSTISVILIENNKKLNEIVVIGYFTQKKADLTGSVSIVSADKLNQGVNQSASHALQGQAADVTVIQNSGEPGSGVEIRVRGAGSINDNSPLYVVDGIIGGIGGSKPDDIESLTVLKDAASAAIYGARGANGVVIVTTKKGRKNQKTTVSFTSTQGIQSAWKMPTSLDATQRNLIHK